MAPAYLSELCQYVSADDTRGRPRSAERGDLITPRSTSKFGDRAIAVSGACVEQSADVTSELQLAVKF